MMPCRHLQQHLSGIAEVLLDERKRLALEVCQIEEPVRLEKAGRCGKALIDDVSVRMREHAVGVNDNFWLCSSLSAAKRMSGEISTP